MGGSGTERTNLQLRSTFYLPPGGRWFYTCPETRRYFESTLSKVDLERQVVRHYETAGLAVPSKLSEMIETHMCLTLPKGSCYGDGEPGSHRPNFFEVVENCNKFFRRIPFVESRIAEQRARVCRRCAMSDLGSCVSCTGLRALVKSAMGGRTTAQDDFLGVCRGLALPAFGLVWSGGPRPPGAVEKGCWWTHE